ncbi:uncharacterized protein LOC136028361 isoform X2 [Artemia franciscana]|uniref:uncharacterized protein LOC136028361 isoform X2 n=1 Tax=Artemia franciscana TaxID=6661 RepID=UPI0032DBA0C4
MVLLVCLLGLSLATKHGAEPHFTNTASKHLKHTVPIVKIPAPAAKPVHFKPSHAHPLHKKPHFVKPLSHNTLAVPVATPAHKIHQKHVPAPLHALHQKHAPVHPIHRHSAITPAISTHNKKHHHGKRDTALSQNAGSSLINFQVQEVNDINTQNTNNAATVNTGTPALGGAVPLTGNFGRFPTGGVSPFSGGFSGNRFGSFPGRFPGQHFGGHGLVHGMGHGHGLGGNRFPVNQFAGNQFGGFGGGFRPHGHFNRPMFF